MKLKKKEDQSVNTSFLLRMGNKIPVEGVNRDKVWSRAWRNDHPETTPLGDPPHKQPPNPDTIAYSRKILLTEPWYSYLLWGTAIHIKNWMLTVMYWMEHRAPNEGARKSTQGAKGVCNPIGGTTIKLTSTPQSCVSSCICIRRWPSRPSMGGKALSYLNIIFPCTGECHG